LIAFTDLDLAPPATLTERSERAARRAKPGSVLFVLRDKERSARERVELGRALASVARGAGQLFGVADRLDLALLLGADALHLGEGSVATEDARRLLGGRAFVTRAVHVPEDAALAEADGVVFSPVIEPRKSNPAWGLGGLARAREKLTTRGAALYALGGVRAENAAACLASGATGVAVIGALFGEEDATPLLRALDILRH
jgi:thiamine-phosphate diphosphorylase